MIIEFLGTDFKSLFVDDRHLVAWYNDEKLLFQVIVSTVEGIYSVIGKAEAITQEIYHVRTHETPEEEIFWLCLDWLDIPGYDNLTTYVKNELNRLGIKRD